MKPTLKIAAALALVAVIGVVSMVHLRQAPSAQQILDRMARRYAECKSYRDSGEVKTGSGSFHMAGSFVTAFVRPDRFRFDFKGQNTMRPVFRYIVGLQRPQIFRWFSLAPEREPPATLSLALAGATGVSGGAAHTIPALLLPDQVKGWRVTDLKAATRIEDGKLDGTNCFCIRGNNTAGGKGAFTATEVVWIDQKNYLLRRVDETIEMQMGTTMDKIVTTTTYNASLDAQLKDDELAFNAPKTP